MKYYILKFDLMVIFYNVYVIYKDKVKWDRLARREQIKLPKIRGEAWLKFNVYTIVVKIKKGLLTNSIDSDETPQNAASHQGLRFLPC